MSWIMSIEKVDNGYITDNSNVPSCRRVYAGIGDVLTEIAFHFNEIKIGERVTINPQQKEKE